MKEYDVDSASAGNIIKNVHHPGNNKLYFGSTISKTSVVIA